MMTSASMSLADWIQGAGAVLQALATAGAVFAAAWLQDRSVARREQAVRARGLEGAAAAAIWALHVWRRIEVAFNVEVMDGTVFLASYREEDFNSALRGIREVRVAEFGDLTLTTVMFRLEQAIDRAFGRFAGSAADLPASGAPWPVMTGSIVNAESTNIFNAAAGVERRVAELVGRPAREDKLAEVPRG